MKSGGTEKKRSRGWSPFQPASPLLTDARTAQIPAMTSMIERVQRLHQLWQHLGPEWLVYRLSYATRIRTGALRRKMPPMEWNEQPLYHFVKDQSLAEPLAYLEYRRTNAPAFFFSSDRRAEYQPYLKRWDNGPETPLKLCDELEQGSLRYFENAYAQAGFPPNWHANAFTGECAPADQHWSEIGDFGHGDIKIIWEPSRFGFTYALVRAYWRTGDERYARMFWKLVGDWREHNLPQLGVNWKCGQEISFRVMAWCFGLYGFLDAETTSAERVALLAQMIAVSGERVQANLDYALSQHNNHGISEGLGLFTIGVLFPELRSAEEWKETGRDVLETQGSELIYDDGAFSQHSVNYHRLMLHDYLWALQLGEVSNQPFTAGLKERVSRAGEFLYQIQDHASGHAPCYGQNDGALILPLSNCDYQDFRPVIQASQYFATQARCYPSGPWDEDLLWLFGPDALNAPVERNERADFQAEQGGCYTLRYQDGFVFTRCASFRHRPGQADLLHVDLWWRGQNIALDAGTFSYNAPTPWDDPLSKTTYHNTVTVDGQEQMERVRRFLWLPWATGSVRDHKRSAAGHLAYWEGEHDGYARLNPSVLHTRGILLLDKHWLVIDRVTSAAEHDYRLHWLLMDAPYEWNDSERRLMLNTPVGRYHVQLGSEKESLCSLLRADESGPRGWHAPYYNHREPALSVAMTTRGSSLYFWTVFGPAASRLMWTDGNLQLETNEWNATLDLLMNNTRLASVRITGGVQDQLDIA